MPESRFHRLFAACPVPSEVAGVLSEFVFGLPGAENCRPMRPQDMHATLLFYPKVDTVERDRLASLMAQVQWEPLHVSVGSVGVFWRFALGVRLVLRTLEAERLGDRLVRSSLFGIEMDKIDRILAEHDRLRQEPLGQLAVSLAQPEMEHKRRSEKSAGYPELHVTLARCRDLPGELPEQGPKLEFVLDRLALYESELSPSGSIYRIIAQAVT